MSTQTVEQQQIPAGTYEVDPVHSSIGFAVVHSGVATFRGGFAEYEARLTGGESPRLEGTVRGRGARLRGRDRGRARARRRGGRVAMRVLGLSGSLRRESHNGALLRTAAERLPAGAELVPFERLAEIPPYDEDLEARGVPDSVRELREAIAAADAVLVATPEYNHSIPGQLKNALDWASRPAGRSALSGKPAAAIGASTGMFGAVWAQAELRKVLGALGGRVVEAELPVGQAAGLHRGARLELAPEQAERLEQILAELVAAAEREPVAA